MELLIKIFNSLLIIIVWMKLDRKGRHLIRTFPFNALIVIAGLLKVYIDIITEIGNPILELGQIIMAYILTCVLERKFSMSTLVSYSLTFIFAKGVWLIGSSLSTMILSIIKMSNIPYMIATVSCVIILALLQLMRKLLQNDIELLEPQLVTIVTAVAWVIYGVSYDLMSGPYTGEDRLIRGYAVLTIVLLLSSSLYSP